MASRWLCLVLALTAACGPDWTPPTPLAQAVSAQIQPPADPASAPDVLRLRIERAERHSALSDFRLFSGTLSAYHLGRIAARELPSTLREREIPVAVWQEPNAVVMAPARVLEFGIYSVATPELGRVLEFTVAEQTSLLERWWPPRSYSEGAGPMLYCGDVTGVELGPVTLPPAGVPAVVEAGIDTAGRLAERCVRISMTADPTSGTLLLPPSLPAGTALDPAALRYVRSDSAAAPCLEGEMPIGPVCVEIQDDRLVLRTFEGPALLSLSAPRAWVGVVEPDTSAVLRGLDPQTSYELSGSLFELGSGERSFSADVVTLPAQPHIVIDEVLSDPSGVERTSEWIELTNDGAQPVSLSNMTFEDAGGVVSLPDVLVTAGERVLLVDDEFAPDPELDLVPPAATRLVRVGTLGKAGLSNQGELLRLRDAAGIVISRFPAEKSGSPGRSLARRTPDAPDDAPSSFGPHLAPGASPGAPNAVEP